MYRFRYFIVLLCMAAMGMGACNRIPDHAKYIPKDAVAVVGIDIKALTKKVAWSAISGSKLFQDMQKSLQGKTGDKTFEDAGIDVMNTMYVYMMGTSNNTKATRITGLVPIADVAKFENFIKGNFPGRPVNQQGKIKTVVLENGMCLGWNDKLLMLMSSNRIMGDEDFADTTAGGHTKQLNETQPAAEMEAAFNMSSENSVVNNDRYAALEHEHHDMFLWVNYEQLMNKYTGQGMSGMMGGLALTNSLWKNTALAAGFDFEKGKIASDMHYYVSDELHSIGKELGATNADKEMINKLPAKNLDMFFAYHLSTKGMRDLLEKMGALGFANVALSAQNMDADYILDAFTGDMALSLNDFKVKMETPVDDTVLGGTASPYKATTRMVNFVYVLKINKKQNFDKLLSLGKDMIHPLGKDAYYFSYYFDSLYMVCNDQYAVISNKPENATAYLQNKGNTIAGAETAYGHPVGIYMDFQQMMSAIDPAMVGSSASDSNMLAESRKLFKNLLFSGAEFKKDNFEYHMELNLINKEENSLVQLMDFAVKISAGKEQKTPPATLDSLHI